MNTRARIDALRLVARDLGAMGLGTLGLGALGLSAVGLSACHREAPQTESAPAVGMGTYRAVLTLPGGELPFGLELEPAGATTVGFLINGIEYATLIAGISDKDEAAKKLPMLDHVYAFPTTIFIDRKGNVRKIHTGFSGPATGDHYTRFVDEVKATLDQLLAET
jgi:hypothetical protein